MKATKKTTLYLTIPQCDELVNNASQPSDGAIEEVETFDPDKVTYYFESGAVATVSRINGTVSIDRSAVEGEMKTGHFSSKAECREAVASSSQ